MARRKIEIFTEINNNFEFKRALKRNKHKLICAEIYCSFAGSCTCLDRLFATIKLDWSDGQMELLKVLIDDIEELKRFWDQSEPIYIFIVNKRVTKVLRGVDHMRLAMVAKKELLRHKSLQDGQPSEWPTYALDEITPDEVEWHEKRSEETKAMAKSVAERQAKRQADRKRHRAELMAPFLKHLNFVLFWPHAKHAHPELYERWDENNIIMVGREEIQLTEEKARDILYSGDADLNEASLHALLAAPALAICFRLLDTDKHFVSLVRQILYKDLSPLDENKKLEDQLPQKTAFDLYKSYSLSREQILKQREEAKIRRRAEMEEKRARRLSEMQRIARQAILDAIQERKNQREQQKLELLKAGNLEALKKLREEPIDEDVGIEIPEELPAAIEEESSEDEEEEYFPPAGLLIPGFYSPPSDIAKANGLALLFPKLVNEQVTPQPEFLPPHVLVMLNAAKRHKAIKALEKYSYAVIHMGIFKVTSPYKAKHLAYSVKQYDSLDLPMDEDSKIVFMLSTATDFPLLALMDLNPEHVSRNEEFGEEECAAIFSVYYGDQYDELEDFEKPIE